MAPLLSEVAVAVEIAYAELAESLGIHQDDIPNADYILTKLAIACYKRGVASKKTTTRRPTEPMFPAVRDDETPRVAIIYDRDLEK